MIGTPDMLVAGLKMVAALGVVLAILFFLLYAMRKLVGRRIGAIEGKRIQVLENCCLGVKKSISLIRVPGKVLVVGVTSDRIDLLGTLEEDIVQQQENPDGPKPFVSMLVDRLKQPDNRFKAKENA